MLDKSQKETVQTEDGLFLEAWAMLDSSCNLKDHEAAFVKVSQQGFPAEKMKTLLSKYLHGRREIVELFGDATAVN